MNPTEDKKAESVIMLKVEVPTENFSTWQSYTLLSFPSSYKPSDLDAEALNIPVQLVIVTIPIDFLTLSRLKMELNLSGTSKKQLKQALIRYYQEFDAKVKSIEIPDMLWEKNEAQ